MLAAGIAETGLVGGVGRGGGVVGMAPEAGCGVGVAGVGVGVETTGAGAAGAGAAGGGAVAAFVAAPPAKN